MQNAENAKLFDGVRKRLSLVVGLLLLLALGGYGVLQEAEKALAAASEALEAARRENEILLAANKQLVETLSVRPRNLKVERDSLVVRTARDMGIDPGLALAIAWVENPWADSAVVSHAGALGLMQVMPPEALEARGEEGAARRRLIEQVCGDASRLIERQCNVSVGLRIYAEYLAWHEDEYLALAAYNGALRYPEAAERYVSLIRDRQARISGEGGP